MPSFDAINYSLRPSKSIQRHVVFDGIDLLKRTLGLDQMLYVGFGSIWFTDFLLAHRFLRIREMISIEGNEVGHRRALFNAPFATVRVEQGLSGEVLPNLLADANLRHQPWLIWLDYDYQLNEAIRNDLQLVIENAPANSMLIATFNGLENKYGTALERVDRLRAILGAVVPEDLAKADCKDEMMQKTLADLTLDFMTATAAGMARPGGFVPAFRVIYRDMAPMVTVGGMLPTQGAAMQAKDIIARADWPARPERPIRAPHLTLKEAAILQSKLPRDLPLTRDQVRALGFDLEDDQIEVYQRYYRQYPAFAQIVS